MGGIVPGRRVGVRSHPPWRLRYPHARPASPARDADLAAIRLHDKLPTMGVYSHYASQADVDQVEAQVREWPRRLAELDP
jgi:hypothetical protein